MDVTRDVVDVSEHLMAEFEDRLDLSIISGIVLQVRHDLAGSPAAALPELVERSARQRLQDAVSALPRPRVPAGS